MIPVPRDVFRDFRAYRVGDKEGIKQVKPTARPQLLGNSRDGGSVARILEYARPGGPVVARLVEACGHVECWLEASLATDTLVARADAEAEKYRVLKEVAAYANATRQKSRDQMAQAYVLSSALVHAAVRHQAKIGRLFDKNSRGNRTRANLASALKRASKAGYRP